MNSSRFEPAGKLHIWMQHHEFDRTVRIVGDVDSGTAPLLQQVLLGVVRSGLRSLCVDIGEVGFIDCAGIRALEHGCRAARGLNSDVVVINASPHTLEVLRLIGSVESALATSITPRPE